jgi:hypothetical protein
MATRLGLHTSFGPSPSVEMLLEHMALMAKEALLFLPLKDPVPSTNWNFRPSSPEMDTWMLATDNPSWGNNAEATTSFGYRRPRLELIQARSTLPPIVEAPRSALNQEIVVYNQEFAIAQIMEQLHPSEDSNTIMTERNNSMEDMIQDMEISPLVAEEESTNNGLHLNVDEELIDASSPVVRKKRKARAKTPMVDDEVKRCSRFRKNVTEKHFMLDKEPRRKNGEARKSVSFSIVEDLKKAIVSRSLDSEMKDAEFVEPIQAVTLISLGTSFCGVPPEELTLAMLNPSNEE